MNAPMSGSEPKTVKAYSSGIKLPDRIKKLLVGAVVMWEDVNPMSEDMNDALHFFFDSKTTAMTDLLLKKNGLTDVSQYVNISFEWYVEMEVRYSMPNHKTKKAFIETFQFKFRGTVFPMTEAFKKKRNAFYIASKLAASMTPDDHKNKGVYEMTYFKLTVVGV